VHQLRLAAQRLDQILVSQWMTCFVMAMNKLLLIVGTQIPMIALLQKWLVSGVRMIHFPTPAHQVNLIRVFIALNLATLPLAVLFCLTFYIFKIAIISFFECLKFLSWS
jgi:hypothetical protein